jgi:SAM-dependent methyltransferase
LLVERARSEKQPNCLDCGSGLTVSESGLFDTRFGILGRYTAAICNSCGLEQIAPPPLQEELNQYYESHYNFGGEHGTKYTSLRHRFLFSPLYRLWTALDGDTSFHRIKGSGRLLDIGCNEGRGLLFYRRNGWKVEGLELNTKAAADAQNLGFTVHDAPVEDFSPTEPYDVVVLSNVLEHSLNPREMLRHVRRMLEPGGQVWISCPNGMSLLRKIFGRSWINWHVPFHVVQFSPLTLGGLLSGSGFGSIVVRQETPALWVAHSLIAALYARHGLVTRQLRNPAIVALLILCIRIFLFPLLWMANRSGEGDCLVVTAMRE